MSDLSRDYHGHWHFRLPVRYSNRLWRSGTEKRPIYWQPNRLCIIGLIITGLPDMANTLLNKKKDENENKKKFRESNSSVSSSIRTHLSVPAMGRQTFG